MTLFTNNPYEKMMIQKPGYQKRDNAPPDDVPPRCRGCPYLGQSPCIGYCIRKIKGEKQPER